MKIPYIKNNLSILSDEGYSAKLAGKLIINDNINRNIDVGSAASQRFKGFPCKMEGVTVILFCLGGTIKVQLEFKSYIMHRGDIFMVRSGQVGEYNDMSSDVRFMLLVIENNFCDPLTNINNSERLLSLLFRGPYIHCSDEEMADFVAIIDYMRRQINNDYLYKEETARGCLSTILFNIYSISYQQSTAADNAEATADEEKGNPRHMEVYRNFMELLHKNFAREHKLQFYADSLCITPKYLSQIIYKVSGHFAKDFINDSLVMESKAMLKSGLSIKQICDQLNFNSTSFFGRFFKNATGCTPFEYQQRT